MKPDRRYLFQEHTIQCVSSFLPCDQYQQWDVKPQERSGISLPSELYYFCFKHLKVSSHTHILLVFFPIFLCSFHVQVFAICLNYYWLFLQFIIVPQRPSFGCSLSTTITTKKTKAVFPVCAIIFCVFNSFKFKYHSETEMLFCTHQKKKLRWRI